MELTPDLLLAKSSQRVQHRPWSGLDPFVGLLACTDVHPNPEEHQAANVDVRPKSGQRGSIPKPVQLPVNVKPQLTSWPSRCELSATR